MKNRYMATCAVAALLSGSFSMQANAATNTGAALGAASGGIETVTVTAERRTESTQEVAMTLQAFSGDTLQQLNVNDLQDVLKYLPNVTYGNNGPGQGEIFMRGLSNGFRGNQSTGTVGLYPNVAIYLDEQSMQFPARNVDIYMADMDRVEVLEGPQGTLFGGGAEAGAVRYITKKPNVDAFEGYAQVSGSVTDGGAPSGAVELVANAPIIDGKLALRAVFYDDHQGGYINNVPATFKHSDHDPGNVLLDTPPNGAGICPDNQPADPAVAPPPPANQFCAPLGLPTASNAALVKHSQNPLVHLGGRVSALYDINDEWNVLITESLQRLDAEGLSVEYPIGTELTPLKHRQVTAFSPSYNKDSYNNLAWTLNGKIGDFSAIYTGGWTVRHVNQQMEYTNYTRTYYGIYYSCTGGDTGWGPDGSPVTCYSPVTNWHDSIRNTHLTEEARISTPTDWRLRGLIGAYWEQFRIYDVMNFNYKTIPECTPAIIAAGTPICSGDVATFPGAFANQPGVRGPTTAFGEDTLRGYDQTAIFGSLDFDIIPNVLTVTAGTRWFQYREFERGSVYSTSPGRCAEVLVCAPKGANDIDANHDLKTFAGFKSRAGVNWHITDDIMAYYLFSQGYRPGGFNRRVKGVLTGSDGNAQFFTPNSYAPDSLQNQEIGLKSEFFDHNLLLDISAYDMRWNHVQFLLFQPLFTGNQTFAINGPTYHIQGVELQFVGRPTDHLTIQGATTWNENTEAVAPCLKDNNAASNNFGNCITQAKVNGSLVNFPNPFGQVGGIAAFSPKWQGNLRASYDWNLLDDYQATAMAGLSFTGSSFNQPANYVSGAGVLVPSTTYLRYQQPAFITFDASFRVAKDSWTASVYGENLGNSHASVFTSSAQWIKSQVPLRPRIVGVKLTYGY